MKQPDQFARTVYAIVRCIPAGRVTSYGAIARAAGHATWSRRVGRAMGASGGWESGLPAHRVVNAAGILSGRGAFGDPGRQQQLLEAEGIAVRNNRIVHWKAVFWDPIEEIHL